MTKSNYDQEVYVIPKNGYKVSESTAAVVDCIRMLHVLYSKVSSALAMIHGDTSAEKLLDEKYLSPWSVLDDLLHDELIESFIDNITELSNLQNENEILL